jgi:hypothetical protein
MNRKGFREAQRKKGEIHNREFYLFTNNMTNFNAVLFFAGTMNR